MGLAALITSARRHARPVAAAALLAALALALVAAALPATYRTSAVVRVDTPATDVTDTPRGGDSRTPEHRLFAVVAVAADPAVLEEVAVRTGRPGTGGELASRVGVASVPRTFDLQVQARDATAAGAAATADALADVVAASAGTPAAPGAEGTSAQVLTRAVPPGDPLWPRPVVAATSGLLAGLVAAAVLAHGADRRAGRPRERLAEPRPVGSS